MRKNQLQSFLDNTVLKTLLVIIAFAGIGLAIYGILQEKKINFIYAITSSTNVLDFNAEIGGLEVYYDSTNLKETNENLRIYTVRISNIGSKDILKEYYDANDPVGLRISTGKVIEPPELISASSKYLWNNSKIVSQGDDTFTFSNVILEKGEFFTYKILVLHANDSIPEIQAVGKVAGQRDILVVSILDNKEDLSFWDRAFGGNIWAQLLRAISYFLGVAILLILLIGTSSYIDDAKKKKRKKKHIYSFKESPGYRYTKLDDVIYYRYENEGFDYLDDMQELLGDEAELNDIYTSLQNEKKLRVKKEPDEDKVVLESSLYDEDKLSTIEQMIGDGFIMNDGTRLIIHKSLKKTLDAFVSFLKVRGENKHHKSVYNEHLIHETGPQEPKKK